MKFPFGSKRNVTPEASEKPKENINAADDPNEQDLEKLDAVLNLACIKIGAASVSKERAIEMAGQLLVDGGYVLREYVPAMLEREKVYSTYIGEGIAIPHGVGTAKDSIIRTGISIIQFPEGIEFDEDKTAYLVIGIAGKGSGHLQILANIAEFIQEGDAIKKLFAAKDKLEIYKAFTGKL